MPGDNANKQTEQRGSGDREQPYRVKKVDGVWAPDADFVNTTHGHDPTAAFFARTGGGGYIGMFTNPEDVARMAERVMAETGCKEIRYKIVPYDPEKIAKFEETAVEKRVVSNHDLPEAEPSEPNTNTKND